MLNRRFILLLAALLAIGTLAPARAQELDKPTARGNVSIELPKGWKVGADGILSAQVPQQDKDPTGSFQASLTITQAAGTKLDGAAQQANVQRKMLNYQPIEKPAPFVTASGLQGVTFGGTFKANGLTALRSRQYMFLVNGQIYTINFICLSSRWNTYAAMIDACVTTFNVKR